MSRPCIVAVLSTLVFCLPGFAEQPAIPQSATVRGPLGAKVDEYMKRLADFGFSGALVVAKDGQVILAKGYGLADREKNIPVTVDTVFSVGSITKQFTAAAILKLEMQGKLSVNDLISKYLPGVPKDKEAITLHHLLTHSAGLESDFGPTDYEAITREAYIQRALASKLRSTPGQRFHYANSGYSLLAAIVEIVSGQDYEAYLQEHLFKPAGMIHTGYRLPHQKPEDFAQGYLGGTRWGTIIERLAAPEAPSWNLRGNGGIHSTIGDMVRWHFALEGESILSPEAKTKMVTPHMPELGGSHYGYGWSIVKTPRGTKLITHNGGNGVFAADFHRYVDEHTVFFIASNKSDAPATLVSNWVARLIFGGTPPTLPSVVAIEAATLAKYAGTYKLPSGGLLDVQVKDAGLTLSGKGEDALARLAGREPGNVEQLDAASSRTREIVKAAFAKDYQPIQKAFGGRMSIEQITTRETNTRRQLEDEYGAWEGFEVIGSIGRGETIETHVRLQFQRGVRIRAYLWDGTTLRGMRPADGSLGSKAFLPTGQSEFASFTFRPPTTLRIHFPEGPDGTLTELALKTPNGEVVAKRSASVDGKQARKPDSPASQDRKDLGGLLETVRQQYSLPGIAAVVMRGDQVIAEGVSGVRQISKEDKIALDDRFGIGSCTKRMTVLMIGRLIDAGKLSLDTTLGDALPDMPMRDDYRNVTVAQLLDFTGGIQPYTQIGPRLTPWLFSLKGTDAERRQQFVKHVLQEEPIVKPGTVSRYSNASYIIAAYLAKTRTNKAWEDLIREEVFVPLGMKDSGFGPPRSADRPDQPAPHIKQGAKYVPAPQESSPVEAVLAGAGYVHCSVRDLAKFAAYELAASKGNDRLLKPETSKRLHPREAKSIFGGNPWLTAGYFTLPEKSLVVAVVVNGGNAQQACEAVYKAVRD